MGTYCNYYIEVKLDDDKWHLINSIDNTKYHYTQGIIRDIFNTRWNTPDFVNRGYPKDMSIELTDYLNKEEEEYKEHQYSCWNKTYCYPKELEDYCNKKIEEYTEDYKKYIEESKLDILSKKVDSIIKYLNKPDKKIRTISTSAKSEHYDEIVCDYEESIEDMKYALNWVYAIDFLVYFLYNSDKVKDYRIIINID